MVEQSNALPKLKVLNSFTGEKVSSALPYVNTCDRMNSLPRTQLKFFGTPVDPPSTIIPTWDTPELTCLST